MTQRPASFRVRHPRESNMGSIYFRTSVRSHTWLLLDPPDHEAIPDATWDGAAQTDQNTSQRWGTTGGALEACHTPSTQTCRGHPHTRWTSSLKRWHILHASKIFVSFLLAWISPATFSSVQFSHWVVAPAFLWYNWPRKNYMYLRGTTWWFDIFARHLHCEITTVRLINVTSHSYYFMCVCGENT